MKKALAVTLKISFMSELTWKQIDGCSAWISNTGLVRRKHYKTGEPIVLKTQINPHGYPVVLISEKGKKSLKLIHRLLAIAFIPNPENKPQVNHINGIKTDNRLDNLEWCTNKENVDHAFKTGLRKAAVVKDRKRAYFKMSNPRMGSEAYNSILSEKDVVFIRSKRYLLTYDFLANVFGVSRHCIKDIMIRKTWGHLKEEGSSQTTTAAMNLKG